MRDSESDALSLMGPIIVVSNTLKTSQTSGSALWSATNLTMQRTFLSLYCSWPWSAIFHWNTEILWQRCLLIAHYNHHEVPLYVCSSSLVLGGIKQFGEEMSGNLSCFCKAILIMPASILQVDLHSSVTFHHLGSRSQSSVSFSWLVWQAILFCKLWNP